MGERIKVFVEDPHRRIVYEVERDVDIIRLEINEEGRTTLSAFYGRTYVERGTYEVKRDLPQED